MIDYKTILRLHSEKFSLRQIAARVGNSHHTVKKVIDAAAKVRVKYALYCKYKANDKNRWL